MLPVKFTASVAAPLHFVWSTGLSTVGVGLTVIVKVDGTPGQPVEVGVTVIVPVIGAFVALVAVNEAISPVPLAAKPIAVLSFVQLYVTPLVMLPVNVTASVVAPLHLAWSAGLFTIGAGLTVMVKDSGVPGQPLIVGVTVIVPLIAVFPALVAVNEAIFPVPLAANPIAVLSFVQLYVTPLVMLPVKFTAVVGAPLHTGWSAGLSTVGVGLTVMVKETGVPGQPFAVGVTSIIPVIAAFVALVAVNEAISPVPLAAKPMAVLSFVQL